MRNKRKDKKEKNNRKIYIVLTLTRTYPARVIHLYTSEPYAHASIAFDEDLEEMYSFARRGIWNPFNAGFVEEDINTGIFGKYASTTCNIYQLNITDSQYIKLREQIDIFKGKRQEYSYNYLGLLGAAVNIPIQTRQRYFCSQFVAYILECSGINIFFKDSALVKPSDIRLNPKLESIYIGRLIDYRRAKTKVLVAE